MKSVLFVTLFVIELLAWAYAETADDLGIPHFESALRFSEKWLGTPKLYIEMVLPTNIPFRIKYPINFVKKTANISKDNTYFLITSNMASYKHISSPQPELLWLPYETKHYSMDCHLLNFLSNATRSQIHLLLFIDVEKNVNGYFGPCEITFNSKIVVYYHQNETELSSSIIFEEIYKIQKHQQKLHRNILVIYDINLNEIHFDGLNTFIWERRKNLQGINFTSISEISPPSVMRIENSSNSNGDNIVHPTGYYPDIMKHLMFMLNFSIITALPQKRHNWTYLVEVLANGVYDIGYGGFGHTRSRIDLVDFSYGIIAQSSELFYVKHSTDLRFDVFLKPFHVGTWNILSLSIFTLICGYIIIAVVLQPGTSLPSFLQNVISNFKKATNFVLRVFIGKRISTEPSWLSSRLAFLVLVLGGFVIISLYRSLLVAFVAVEIETPPITSLDELKKSNYILAVGENTMMDDAFLNATPGTVEYELNNSKKIFRFSGSYEKHIEKMNDTRRVESNTILYHVDNGIMFSEHYPCSLFHVRNQHKSFKQSNGWIFKRHWQYTTFFNYHLLIMKEKGVMDKLFQPYLKTTKEPCSDQLHIRPLLRRPKAVGLNTTVSGYVIVFTGLICSAIVLLLERMCP